MKTSKKGISLIVLVITIIVMIILATVIILSLSGSDIRGKAEEAVSATDMVAAREAVAVARSEWESNYYALRDKYNNSFKEYAKEKLKEAGIDYVSVSNSGLINIVYKDDNGDKAIIPEGFTISTVAEEQTIEEGLVIVDKVGNEFVWIPVDDMNMFKRTTTYTGTITEDKNIIGTEPFYKLSPSNDPTGEVAEYNAMYASVQENKGFYIARYEAGKEGTDTLVSKKGATVWSNIPWGTSMTEIGTEGAVYRARHMYKYSKSVVSTLCYGVQWDSALQFISTRGVADKEYAIDSAGKGNYNIDVIEKTGYYELNNIYDMAGNVSEWTMESYVNNHRFQRSSRTSGGSASDRVISSLELGANPNLGFRVTLYIK